MDGHKAEVERSGNGSIQFLRPLTLQQYATSASYTQERRGRETVKGRFQNTKFKDHTRDGRFRL